MDSYNNYLQQYPRGSFSQEARLAINELKDKLAWDFAKTKDTPEAYYEYFRTSPNGRYRDEAEKRGKSLMSKKTGDSTSGTLKPVLLSGGPAAGAGAAAVISSAESHDTRETQSSESLIDTAAIPTL